MEHVHEKGHSLVVPADFCFKECKGNRVSYLARRQPKKIKEVIKLPCTTGTIIANIALMSLTSLKISVVVSVLLRRFLRRYDILP